MKYFLMLCFSLSTFLTVAQVEQQQINKDVWYNFMQAYQDLDAALFNQIHTNDVMRVLADQEEMLLGREYLDRNLDVFNRWNAAKVKQKMEFSFMSRSQKGDWAYEIGIYKLTRYSRSGEQRSYYGKFNVTLKKTDGLWKIKIDSDTSEGQTIGEEDFLKGDILK